FLVNQALKHSKTGRARQTRRNVPPYRVPLISPLALDFSRSESLSVESRCYANSRNLSTPEPPLPS
ncbi:MAG: hypothetical protein LBS59_08050, partial [Puniceicoccales bacterium]|nr:hypothetical protein [Puniceicoccales bacterium]